MEGSQRFSQDDFDKFNLFLKFILDHAKWADLSTEQALDLGKYLNFVNGLNSKIRANIFEITRSVEPPPPVKKKTTKKKRG